MGMLSVRQYTRRSIMVLLGVLCFSMVLLFLALRTHLLAQARITQQQRVAHQAENLSQTIRVYRGIVERLSARTEVADMLALSLADEAHDWATRMRSLLPGSVGLALFDDQGMLLGEPLRLRLGEMCRLDMHHYLSGEILPGPRVHRGVKGLEHFDLVASVNGIEGPVGVVFASFRLDLVQQALDRVTSPGQSLALLAYDGSVIAQTGRPGPDAWDYRTPVPGTAWTLQAFMPAPALDAVVVYFLVAFAVLATLLAVFLALTTRKLGRLFIGEMESIHRLVRELQEDNPGLELKPRLRESRRLFNAIRGLAENIAARQRRLLQQSTIDDLTGVHNRRLLEPACAELLDFVKSGGKGCLVIVDIDHFKQANDLHGHATGDRVLKCLADALTSRGYEDTCIRFGGDEFVILLRGLEPAGMARWFHALSERFRANLAAAGIPGFEHCTLSAGAAALAPDMEDCSRALRRADEALYQAKKGGRNRVVVDAGETVG